MKRILSWRHSGFNVHCGPKIQSEDEEAMENLARYIIRASFSQERMTYIPDQILKHLGVWEADPPQYWRVKPKPPPRMTKTQYSYSEPYMTIPTPRSLLPIIG